MRNLLNFLIKYNYWFLFIILEMVSLFLLYRFNNYQQGVFFTSSNLVVGKIYEASSSVTGYFHLRTANDDLLERNMLLEQRVSVLEDMLKEYMPDSLMFADRVNELKPDYTFHKAHVINNSVSRADNYITIDKGAADGIRPEMGVVDGRGVVGIVYLTSSSYSVVISLLNSKSNISCKIKSSDYFGYLRWEEADSRYAYLKDLPRHAHFSLGDTVITSGYSTVFPEGVMVGTVDDMSDSTDGLSYNLKIKLAADFGKLSGVHVLARTGQQEQLELEKRTETK